MAPGVVLVVPGAVLVVPCEVLVVPVGVAVVVPGCDVVLVVGAPIPLLGVTVPVFCAVATSKASANTADANRILCIELAPCKNCCGPASRTRFFLSKNALVDVMRQHILQDGAAEFLGILFFLCRRKAAMAVLHMVPWTNTAVCFYSAACTIQW